MQPRAWRIVLEHVIFWKYWVISILRHARKPSFCDCEWPFRLFVYCGGCVHQKRRQFSALSWLYQWCFSPWLIFTVNLRFKPFELIANLQTFWCFTEQIFQRSITHNARHTQLCRLFGHLLPTSMWSAITSCDECAREPRNSILCSDLSRQLYRGFHG